MTREIPLTKGLIALVDDEDYEVVGRTKWQARQGRYTWYAERRSTWNGPTVSMHRLIMLAPQGREVDHINGNGLDNRRCNLRVATRSQNAANAWYRRIKQTSQYRGVSWDATNKKWQAHISRGGKSTRLGRYVDEVTAAQAYDDAAIEEFGEFATLNFPDPRKRATDAERQEYRSVEVSV